MFIVVKGYTYTSIENIVHCKMVYSPNSNNLLKTLILLHNSTDMSEKSV